MTKLQFRGVTLDVRTAKMILWAEKTAGFKFKITQGSYTNGVAASAGTHDGGGAVDISVRLLTPWRRKKTLNTLKDAGFAAWYRTKADGFDSAHIHAIAIGCEDLATLAKSQVKDYDKGLNGLKSHAPDLTYRPNPKVKFSLVLGRPVSREKAK